MIFREEITIFFIHHYFAEKFFVIPIPTPFWRLGERIEVPSGCGGGGVPPDGGTDYITQQSINQWSMMAPAPLLQPLGGWGVGGEEPDPGPADLY